MWVELHCHSTCSDGTHPPEAVAGMAAARSVALFCLTDHDTDAGYSRTVMILPGAVVLRGMELSCKEYGRTIHLLVLGLHDGHGLDRLRERIDRIQLDRRDRIVRICERLRRLGHVLDPGELLAAAIDRSPGRPDVARALVRAGVVTSIREAFVRFLHDGGPADVPIERLDVAEALELVRGAGARASLAHPHSLGEFALVRDLFQRMRGHGLDGIEALYGRYAVAEREPWLRLAREFDLVTTAGSDFHGDAIPEVARPGVEVPDTHGQRLLSWLGV